MVTEKFLGLPEKYISCVAHDKVRCILVAFNHRLPFQAFDNEYMIES